MLFNTGYGLVRAAAAAATAYVSLVIVLRLSGKRTLAKLNAFDLVVTVALGSALATVALSDDVALVEGVLVLALLVSMQFVVAWVSVRASVARRVTRARPVLLVEDGLLRLEALREQRILDDEVRQAVRASGVGGLDLVAAVVLETDGSLSVITRDRRGSGDAIASVDIVPDGR